MVSQTTIVSIIVIIIGIFIIYWKNDIESKMNIKSGISIFVGIIAILVGLYMIRDKFGFGKKNQNEVKIIDDNE